MSERYIKLNGDVAGKSLRSAFHRAQSFKAVGLLFTFDVAVGMVANPAPLSDNLVSLAFNTVAYAGIWGFARFLQNRDINKVFNRDRPKYIDTLPDRATTPTKPYDILRAMGLSDRFAFMSRLSTAFVGGMLAADVTHKIMTNKSVALSDFVSSACLLAAYPLCWAQAWYRFNKIVRGDHHIIDRPPPKEETVKVANLAPAPSAI